MSTTQFNVVSTFEEKATRALATPITNYSCSGKDEDNRPDNNNNDDDDCTEELYFVPKLFTLLFPVQILRVQSILC